jgi:hypothetical protein
MEKDIKQPILGRNNQTVYKEQKEQTTDDMRKNWNFFRFSLTGIFLKSIFLL